jgi:hypothetical protein
MTTVAVPGPPRRARLVLLAATAVVGSLYAWTASGGQPLGFGEPLEAPYNLLAQALTRGQLHLLVEPSPELFRVADPYEPGRNANVRLHDASLYRGRYYYYFGVVPAVVAFCPWRLAGLGDLPEPAAALAFGLGAFVLSALVLLRLVRAHLPPPSAPFLFGALLALGAFNLLPFLLRSPRVYEVAIAAGLFFSTAAALSFLRASEGGGLASLALGGACLGLAVGCRPNVVVLAAALPLLAWRPGAPETGDPGGAGRARRPILAPAAAVGAPLALVLLLLGLYNHARFDSGTEFGASYQLIGDRRISWLDPRHAPTILYYLFLAPPSWSREFPFLHPYHAWPFPGPVPDGLFLDQRTTGLLLQTPFLLILAAAFPVLRRAPLREGRLLRQRLLVLAAAGLLLPLATSVAFASVAMRFAGDFATLLALPALLLWLALAGSPVGRLRLGLAAGAAFGWSLLVVAPLSLTGALHDFRGTTPPLLASLAQPVEPFRLLAARLFARGGRARVRARLALPERPAAESEPLVSWGTGDAYDVLWLRSTGPGGGDLVLETAASRAGSEPPPPVVALRARPRRFHDLEVDIDRTAGRVSLRLDGGPAVGLSGRLVAVHRNRIWPGRGPRGRDAPTLPPFSGSLIPEAMMLAGPPGLERLPPVADAPAVVFDEASPAAGPAGPGQLRVRAATSGAEIFTGSSWRWIPRAFVDAVRATRRIEAAAGEWAPVLVSGGPAGADGVFARRLGGRVHFRLARWDEGWRVVSEGLAVGERPGALAEVTLDRAAGKATASYGGVTVLAARVDLLPLALARLRLGALPPGLPPSD